MIMVDGFGVPSKGWFNSVYSDFCDNKFVRLLSESSMPVDTGMGVEGLPQSATSQTALFTGINAAKFMGMHLQGFPCPKLREIIKKYNIFSKLIEKGKKVAFANAYVQYTLEELEKIRLRSVTTVMVESSLGWVRTLEDLLTGKAVYHDLTRKTIADKASIPEISPKQAAKDLVNIAKDHDFTLFEYFLTDKAGHKQDIPTVKNVLGDLSSFVCELVDIITDNMILIITGDHGNCEDLSTRKHTANPVPFFIYGNNVPKLSNMNSIEQIYHFILKELFPITEQR